MTISTRKPTSKPSWPVLLLAGAEKSGKSWACAQASVSDKIGRTLWVSVGETDPDQYGAIPGADFEIVEHDGRVSSIINVLAEIASLPSDPESPTLLVVDSMTRLWEQCSQWAQGEAQRRHSQKGKGGEAQVTMDLWNRAKAYHHHAVQAILAHQGPALLTARLEPVTMLDDRGRPTPIKADKIKSEKSLPYDVDGVIEMPSQGEVYVSGLRSVVMQLQERTAFPGFTVDGLWSSLGLEDTASRQVAAVADEGTPGEV